MSADKDRGIRRQKQKRAKEMKRQARELRTPAVAASMPPPKAGSKPAA